MDITTFNSYTIDERMALLNKGGEYISRISFYGYIVNLYVYDRLYIEVYYNRHRRNIAEIEVLDPKEERLHQYAVHVNLSQLYRR